MDNANTEFLSSMDEIRARIDQQASAGLDRTLGRAKVGTTVDIRAPFYDRRPREEIIDIFRDSIGFTNYSELTGIDENEISKIGPYSIMLPWAERRESVDAFRKQEHKANDKALLTAVERVSQLFNSSAFRPMDLDTAARTMPHGTMMGLPTMSSDKSREQEYLQRAKSIESASGVFPAVAGWRGQPKGLHEVPKQRLVWMMDHVETILGLSILYPVLTRLRVLNGFSAWSSDTVVDTAITRLLRNARAARTPIVSADFSNFDASVSDELLGFVFDILRYWFADSAVGRLDLLERVCTTVPLVTPDGVFTDRTGGVPSGSALTNLIDTLVNLVAGTYVSVRLGVRLVDYEILGDDSVYVFTPFPGVEEISDAMKELGLDSNPDKQFVSWQSAHFLQRWHSLDYSPKGIACGVRSPYRALNGMMSLERWIGGSKGEEGNDRFKFLMCAALIMKAENVRNDPRFHKFVELVKEGDSILSSGIDPAVVFRRAGGSDEIRSRLSIASYPFNVQNPDNVEVFATTRILRELA